MAVVSVGAGAALMAACIALIVFTPLKIGTKFKQGLLVVVDRKLFILSEITAKRENNEKDASCISISRHSVITTDITCLR